MHIGMTWEQFWYDSPYIAVLYREKHNIDKDADSTKMWIQGQYIFEAFNSVMSSYMRGLTVDKNSQPFTYAEEPYRLSPISEEEKAQKERAEQMKKAKELERKLLAFQRAFERRQNNEINEIKEIQDVR